MAFLPSSRKSGPDFHLRADIYLKLSAVILKDIFLAVFFASRTMNYGKEGPLIV